MNAREMLFTEVKSIVSNSCCRFANLRIPSMGFDYNDAMLNKVSNETADELIRCIADHAGTIISAFLPVDVMRGEK